MEKSPEMMLAALVDEELVSNLLWGVTDAHLNPEDKNKVLAIIRQNPDIFPCFYHIPDSTIKQKYAILKKTGLIL